MTYSAWMAEVDCVLEGVCGFGSADLPDGPSWDAWNDGESPEEYADLLLASVGYFDFVID